MFAAGQITGAGSTWVYPLVAKWAATYAQQTGVQVNYQPIGSGGGIQQIKAGTVAFGASDMPLTPDVLSQNHLIQFPTAIAGEDIVYNLPGVESGKLLLTGPVIADIYLGKITKWNDPAIRKLNPRLHLPDMTISVVHRSDGSGTTFTFADYLSKVSPEWKQKVGENTSINWPVGVGGKGNQGVACVRAADSGLDRLRGVRVHPRESHGLRAHDQQRGQGGEPEPPGLPGRGGERGFHEGAGLLRDPDGSARRAELADFRLHLADSAHDRAEVGERAGDEVLPLGLRARPGDGEVDRLRAAAAEHGARRSSATGRRTWASEGLHPRDLRSRVSQFR